MNTLDQLSRMAADYLADWDDQYKGPLRNYWGERTVLELQYAARIAAGTGQAGEDLVNQAIAAAWADFTAEGSLTRQTCLAVESLLQPLAGAARQFTLLCIGHAHIDMNWMWSYDETVSITLDTFRTMLDLMREYPDFTYAQSQASVYEIVARHDPAMLDEIRARIREGRWEVTAATWVEADRNLPATESMVRQLLYTRRYLSELLDLAPDKLDLDYEPDTFGHNRDVPEILNAAGIRYYYHCRGDSGPNLYRWQAPTGKSILVFREPLWYNWNIDGRCAMIVPDFCRSHGLTQMLRVYGVGDHGGGPTRRDIERIQDMDTWPIFPHYRFATYHDFFRSAEVIADRLPVVSGELNFIFDGCYTTQTRIKKGNRRAEAALFEAETLGALTCVALKRPYPGQTYSDAWKNVLFNQFHDILPGSGTVDTREYALGLYQQTFAQANTQRAGCLRLLASQVDTSGLAVQEDIRLSRSEGAGVGYPTGSGNLAQVGRHAGLRRIFLVWNPLPFDREECCSVTLWDWPGDPARMRLSDGQGRRLLHQLLKTEKKQYWGHIFQNVLVQIPVPALGYATLVLDEEPQALAKMGEWDMRTLTPLALVLENEHLRVQISALNGNIVSLTDKATGQELARPGMPLLTFRLIEEDTERGMTAWTIGRYKKITELSENVRIVGSGVKTGALQSSLTWQVSFGRQSSLEATLSLDAGSRQLNLDCTVRWQEIGSAATCIPQLNLLLQPAYVCSSFRYDIPLGTIDRPALDHDVPALTYGLALNPAGCSLMLASDSKYGFRGSDEGLALTLIRSSYDPDPWPEIGEHKIRLALALAGESDLKDSRIAQSLNHPLYALASQAHPGVLPLKASLVRLAAGRAHLETVKISEDGHDLIVRLSSRAAEKDHVQLDFILPPRLASRTDLHEQNTDGIADQPWLDGRSVRLELSPLELATLRIGF